MKQYFSSEMSSASSTVSHYNIYEKTISYQVYLNIINIMYLKLLKLVIINYNNQILLIYIIKIT